MTIRKLLQAALPTESDFTAFLIDHFPDVQKRISSTSDRLAQENILLQCVDHESLLHLLRDSYPYHVAMNEVEIPNEYVQKWIPAHFFGIYSNYIKIPRGYIRIKWKKQTIFMRPASYKSTEKLMNSLFVSYLSNDFKPYSYGTEWIMYRYQFDESLSTGREPLNRLAVPFDWVNSRKLTVEWSTTSDFTSFFPTEDTSYSILDLRRPPPQKYRIIGLTGDDYENLIEPLDEPYGGKYLFRLITHKNCLPRIGSAKTIKTTDIPYHTHNFLYIIHERVAENLVANIERKLLSDEFIILEQIGSLDSEC